MSFIVPIVEYRQRCYYCCREDKRGIIIDPFTFISAMMAMMMNFLLPTVTATPISLLNASSSTQTESETSSSTSVTTTSTTLVNNSVSLDLPSIIIPSFNESEEGKAIQHVIPGT